MGLFIGCSLLSFFEIIEILIEIVSAIFQRKTKIQNNSNSSTQDTTNKEDIIDKERGFLHSNGDKLTAIIN
jgi:hypothetical protein